MSWIPLINSGLLATAGCILALLFTSPKSQEDAAEKPLPKLPKKTELPPSAFKLESSAYERIGEGPFNLVWKTPSVELPDLREELQYYGKNARPDIKEGRALFHVALKTNNLSISAEDGVKTYLIYSKGAYTFSPENQPTSLWLEMTPASSDAANSEYLNVIVTMKNEDGTLTTVPEQSHLFTLKAQEIKNPSSSGWELQGGLRVDGSLLARQRARFVGPDLFLQKHGGEEFARAKGRDRIDFVDGDSLYSVFIKEGDFLLWKEGKWSAPLAHEDTTKYPLLVVKKIDEKMVFFEIWEAQGRGELPLNLVKLKMHDASPDMQNEFKFVGAKTWAQFIIEIRGKRMILRPNDWLILSKDGWKKIETPDEVDAYVNQSTIGPLFVLEKMVKKEGRSVLLGHLYNTSRTDEAEIELGNGNGSSALPKGNSPP